MAETHLTEFTKIYIVEKFNDCATDVYDITFETLKEAKLFAEMYAAEDNPEVPEEDWEWCTLNHPARNNHFAESYRYRSDASTDYTVYGITIFSDVDQ